MKRWEVLEVDPHTENKDSRFVTICASLLSAGSLAMLYYSIICFTSGGSGVSQVIQATQPNIIGYSQCLLELLATPAGMLGIGLSSLIFSSGVLLHFNWARIGLISLSTFSIMVSLMAVACIIVPGMGPVDRFWHSFGFNFSERLAITSGISLALIALMVALIRELRSKKYIAHYC